jgi:hypothetical protein
VKDIKIVSCETDDVQLKDVKETLPNAWSWKQAYSTDMTVDGKPKKVVIVPFAEAGQNATEVEVWIKNTKMNFK